MMLRVSNVTLRVACLSVTHEASAEGIVAATLPALIRTQVTKQHRGAPRSGSPRERSAIHRARSWRDKVRLGCPTGRSSRAARYKGGSQVVEGNIVAIMP
ncbi:hypothetical protein EDC04DRAFT_2692240 [Pisolithus marmoratus]|nr:hypothetical protein EDC04DRAFT_2692240 [Pisolithus marmoratus]